MPATADSHRHFLTRADFDALSVPAERVREWLATGSIEQIGELVGGGAAAAVFAVHALALRRELQELLRTVGKPEATLAPLQARSQLARALLSERGVDDWGTPSVATADATVGTLQDDDLLSTASAVEAAVEQFLAEAPADGLRDPGLLAAQDDDPAEDLSAAVVLADDLPAATHLDAAAPVAEPEPEPEANGRSFDELVEAEPGGTTGDGDLAEVGESAAEDEDPAANAAFEANDDEGAMPAPPADAAPEGALDAALAGAGLDAPADSPVDAPTDLPSEAPEPGTEAAARPAEDAGPPTAPLDVDADEAGAPAGDTMTAAAEEPASLPDVAEEPSSDDGGAEDLPPPERSAHSEEPAMDQSATVMSERDDEAPAPAASAAQNDASGEQLLDLLFTDDPPRPTEQSVDPPAATPATAGPATADTDAFADPGADVAASFQEATVAAEPVTVATSAAFDEPAEATAADRPAIATDDSLLASQPSPGPSHVAPSPAREAAAGAAAAPPAPPQLEALVEPLQQIHLALLALAERPQPKVDLSPLTTAVEDSLRALREELVAQAGAPAVAGQLDRVHGAIVAGNAAVAEALSGLRASATVAAHGVAVPRETHGRGRGVAALAPWLLMLSGWVGALWLHTGDPRSAMLALVGANLLGCIALLWRRA